MSSDWGGSVETGESDCPDGSGVGRDEIWLRTFVGLGIKRMYMSRKT